MSSTNPSRWEQIVQANPDHSTWYIERFRQMAQQGKDLDGEARMIDAMLPRGSRILDAGCGPGRVGGSLARRGHTVVGVDVDPTLIAAAEADHPEVTWLVGDISELDLPDRGISEPFDAIVMAGNVMTFLAEGSEAQTLARLREHLAASGRLVVGFGAGRGYALDDYAAHVREAGLREDLRLGTWDLRPFGPESDFLVSILTR
ncbi:class I SAM-dependent methyltransferase [Serinibacter salmoneus]|uniref:Methyltransferase family protein n=1 Tax=Serinibacter salmoneus TaxID=556530 RepID=A0A2A9CWL6_9MICO|nr:class I SAM-dependent methyltransferase [Serinibacter salmoneus]PFG18827.1 methyltransferase family protein [Serinibacter salmoneus]